ncbi:hypothetical protein PLEOSDRAFT_154782 [Pleurotus ostreatus PC15]|uniref:SHSP domain-containing protein n=1 Tax=Pleurotus ostreatus (strain PC15) TaxID=1137138 RepID=A0A067NPS2_PLEO1|nr:hypothetical protein PLEOSDRAFT_154782 [Pleurotus ostreatus PC15]
MYAAWEERWTLDSGVKKAMADFFREAVGSEQKKTPKATKGSSCKGSKVTKGSSCKGSKVTKGSRSLDTRSSKTSRKVHDHSQPTSIASSSVSASKHTRIERDDDDSPKTQPVPPPPLIESNIDEPTDHQANHDGDLASNQADDDRSDNLAAITTSINPYKANGDRLDVHEPIVYESTSKDTIKLVVVLPGVHADGVAITLAEGILSIVVENAVVNMNQGPVITEHKIVRLEYKKMLAKGIQAEDIHAWMKNGLLTVTCPMKDTTPRLIKILTSSPKH